MKTKLIITLTTVIISLLLFGCTVAPNQVSIEVSCDDFYENRNISNEVRVATGGIITLALCSNQSAGFQWEPATCPAVVAIVVANIGHSFVPPEEIQGLSPAPGAPGKEIWLFKAYNKGTAIISLVYIRQGEGADRAEWTYELKVNVK